MILASEMIRVALVTTHFQLSEMPGRLTRERILEQLKALDYTLET